MIPAIPDAVNKLPFVAAQFQYNKREIVRLDRLYSGVETTVLVSELARSNPKLISILIER